MEKSLAAILRGIVLFLAVFVLLVGVSGCQKQEEPGPMEQAGKIVDEGIESTTSAVEKAGTQLEEGVQSTKEQLEEGVQSTKDTMKDVGDTIKEGAEKTADTVKDTAEQVEKKVWE